MARTVESLNETVDTELADLPADMRARLVRISELIDSVGVRAFIRKTEKTPTGEIDLVIQRAKELKG